MNCLRVTIHFRSGERLIAWVRDMEESVFVQRMLGGILKEEPLWVNLDRLPEGKGLQIVNLSEVKHIEVSEAEVESEVAWAHGAGLLPPKERI